MTTTAASSNAPAAPADEETWTRRLPNNAAHLTAYDITEIRSHLKTHPYTLPDRYVNPRCASSEGRHRYRPLHLHDAGDVTLTRTPPCSIYVTGDTHLVLETGAPPRGASRTLVETYNQATAITYGTVDAALYDQSTAYVTAGYAAAYMDSTAYVYRHTGFYAQSRATVYATNRTHGHAIDDTTIYTGGNVHLTASGDATVHATSMSVIESLSPLVTIMAYDLATVFTTQAATVICGPDTNVRHLGDASQTPCTVPFDTIPDGCLGDGTLLYRWFYHHSVTVNTDGTATLYSVPHWDHDNPTPQGSYGLHPTYAHAVANLPETDTVATIQHHRVPLDSLRVYPGPDGASQVARTVRRID